MKAKFFKYYATNANDKYINAICFEGTEVDCFKCKWTFDQTVWFKARLVQYNTTLPEKGFSGTIIIYNICQDDSKSKGYNDAMIYIRRVKKLS